MEMISAMVGNSTRDESIVLLAKEPDFAGLLANKLS